MSARVVTNCGLCGSWRLKPVLSLGTSPPTCAMTAVGVRARTVEHHPLELLCCSKCSLVQLSVIVDPEVVFPPGYPYSSGNSRALHQNFRDLRDEAHTSTSITATDLVVDIGANDGTLLSKFPDCRTVGVEPTGQAMKVDGPVFQEFFTEELAKRIVAEHGQARVVTACNVLAHVEDIHDVMKGINVLLADDGILIAENHDLASVVDGGQWDTVYHEHLRFFDPYSFQVLLERHGIPPVMFEKIPTHGGSFRTIAQKRSKAKIHAELRDYNFGRLQQFATRSRLELRRAAVEVVGIGATARATTIINYCGLDYEDVEYVCEVSGSDKIGHYIPGTRIPIVDEKVLFDEPQTAILFSWHMADTIIPKLRERGFIGEIIIPLPTPAYA